MSLQRVLVVDDVDSNIDIMLDMLGDDYDVSVAMDGESVLELMQEELPDIILLDVLMPGMSGYEVCEHLKSHQQTKHIPIVFVSAKGSTEDQRKGLALGAAAYLSKPVDSLELQATMHRILNIRG